MKRKCVLLIYLVLCGVLWLCIVCRRPLSGVPNIATLSRMSIVNCPFGFLQRLFKH